MGWIEGFAIVNFHKDLGPQLEHEYPANRFASKFQNLPFLCLPELNNQACQNEMAFSGRLANNQSENLFVYVYFRQTEDHTENRGFMQKSVVLVSQYPYFDLFTHVICLVGHDYFQAGICALESVYATIARYWPAPEPDGAYQLQLPGGLLNYRVPCFVDEKPDIIRRDALLSNLKIESPSQTRTRNMTLFKRINPRSVNRVNSRDSYTKVALDARFCPEVSGNPQDISLYLTFLPFLKSIWRIWEFLVSGHSIMVYSPSRQGLVSSAVFSLRNLLMPIRFAGQVEPLLNVYNTSYEATLKVVQAADWETPRILGVTNPLVMRNLASLPVVLVLGAPGEIKHFRKTHKILCRAKDSHSFIGFRKGLGPGWLTQTTWFAQESKIINELGLQDERMFNFELPEGEALCFAQRQNACLKGQLLRMTTNFLNAFREHLPPGESSPVDSSLEAPVRSPGFHEDGFLAKLSGPSKPDLLPPFSARGAPQLYADFLRSAHFQDWKRSAPLYSDLTTM